MPGSRSAAFPEKRTTQALNRCRCGHDDRGRASARTTAAVARPMTRGDQPSQATERGLTAGYEGVRAQGGAIATAPYTRDRRSGQASVAPPPLWQEEGTRGVAPHNPTKPDTDRQPERSRTRGARTKHAAPGSPRRGRQGRRRPPARQVGRSLGRRPCASPRCVAAAARPSTGTSITAAKSSHHHTRSSWSGTRSPAQQRWTHAAPPPT